MTVYIFLLIYIFIDAYIFLYKYKSRKSFLILAFSAMALVLGFRGSNVGEDTTMYLRIAEVAKERTWRSIFESFPNTTWSVDQWGFQNKINTPFFAFSKLSVIVLRTPQAVLITSSIVICVGFARFIYQNTNRVFLATYVFLCDSIFMMSFNGMRQCFAMSIGLQAYTCLKENRYFKGVLYIVIGALFHSAAWIYLLLLPILIFDNKKRELYVVITAAVASPVLLILLQRFVARFSYYYASYFTTSFWKGSLKGTILLFLFILLFSVYAFILHRKKISNEQYDLIFMMIIWISLEIAGMKATMVSRLAMFFRAFLILYFPTINDRLTKKNRFIYDMSLVLLLGIEYLRYASSTSRLYIPFWN